MPASSLLLVASDLLLRTIKFCAVSFGVMLRLIVTSSSAVAERPCDALYPSVVSFNKILWLQIYDCLQLSADLLSLVKR